MRANAVPRLPEPLRFEQYMNQYLFVVTRTIIPLGINARRL